MRNRLARWWPAWMLSALVLVLGFTALDRYNVTWDEALGDLFFGQRNLSFYTSFDPVYLDVRADPYPPGHVPDLRASPFRGRPWEYYPFANTLAAATSRLLARFSFDPFDGFHAVNLWLAVVLILVFYGFLRRHFGRLAATLALGFLFGSPRVVFHMMANIKDFPLMVLWTLASCAFFEAWRRGSLRGMLGAGALVGLALATKGNALFFPILPALVLLVCGVPSEWGGGRRSAVRLALAGLGAGCVAVAVAVACWPYLWADPAARFSRHLAYIAGRRGFTSPESLAPVTEALAWTTPPVFLLVAVAGGVWLLFRLRRRRPVEVFLLAWCVASLGRYLLPQAVNFDGVRHFLELFPALAAIAGLATAALARRVAAAVSARPRTPVGSRLLSASLGALALLPGAWAVARTHPFQIAYWSPLVGGYDGARERGLPQASDYWGASYRLGMEWLNEHAEVNAYLAVPVVEHAVRLVAPLRLRPDLTLLPVTTPLSPRIAPERLAATRRLARHGTVYVMFVERRDWANELMLDCLRDLEPEATWTLEGAPVLSIYRYRPP